MLAGACGGDDASAWVAAGELIATASMDGSAISSSGSQ
jgi:hypothetical protein